MEAPAPKPAPEEETSFIEYSETILPQRLLAGLIDGILAAALLRITNIFLPEMVSYGFAVGYLLFKDNLPFLDGQSVGKKLMKIQAVSQDGKPLTNDFITGIKRNIFFAIPPIALVEIFVLNSREKESKAGLRLGDDFAKTKVIKVASNTPEPSEDTKQPEE